MYSSNATGQGKEPEVRINDHGQLPQLVDQHHDSVVRSGPSPFQNLPHEMLLEIFFILMLDGGDYPKPCIGVAPLLLCRICSLWRVIVLGNPKFWSGLGNPFSNVQQDSIDIKLGSVRAWLNRAKGLPLAVSMDSEEEIPSISQTFAPYQNTLQKLDLSFPGRTLELLCEIPSFPCLETLRLQVRSKGFKDTPAPEALNTAFKYAPVLRHVELLGFRNLDTRLLKLPWPQLTFLHLATVIIPPRLVPMLEHCTNLEVCKLDVISWNFLPPTVIPDMLPRLHTLHVIADESTLFQQLNLPSLKNLEIQDCSAGSWDSQTLLDFQSRSSFQLESLTILHDDITSYELEPLLPVMPSLVSLTIDSGDTVGPRLFDILTYSPTAPLLPKLQVLVVYSWADAGRALFESDALCALLVSRCLTVYSDTGSSPPVSKLRRLEIGGPPSLGKVLNEQILRCCQDGLDFELKTSCPGLATPLFDRTYILNPYSQIFNLIILAYKPSSNSMNFTNEAFIYGRIRACA